MDTTPGALVEFDVLVEAICDRLAQNKRVRRKLPGGGRLHIDRQLPFLCVYRRAVGSEGDEAEELVTGQASYLVASGEPEHQAAMQRLCARVLETLGEHFGAVLLLEIWEQPVRLAAKAKSAQPRRQFPIPRFRILTPETETIPSALESFASALRDIQLEGKSAEAHVLPDEQASPVGLQPLADAETAERLHCFRVGVEVRPVYRDDERGESYPVVLSSLRLQFGRALQRAVCAFAGIKVSAAPKHYDKLGRRELLRWVGDSDSRLSDVADAFDFLLLVTPVNSNDAWCEFQQDGCDAEPTLSYRPLPFDPNLLKRQLYQIPLEQIEDPTLAILLRQKQDELDRQITMLRERGTRRFLYGSLQLYGEVPLELLQLAEQLLAAAAADADRSASDEDEDCEGEQCIGAREFARRAKQEFAHYRQRYPEFQATVELRDDIASGVMVSGHRLLVSHSLSVTKSRVSQLLHHEVGTHLLTWFNGRAQPLRQLSSGLAGYEATQEGLAVMAEYLVGGLGYPRLQVLAARVVACHCVQQGASFVETYRRLHDHFELPARTAFTTTLRVFRGGGLTKDAIYLKGLVELLQYLGSGHEIDPLFVGKIALSQLPMIQELRRREIIQPAMILPRYLANPRVRRKLDNCCRLSVLDLAGE